MKKIKKKPLERRPSTPGEVLKELFLGEELSQGELSQKLFEVSKNNIKLSTIKTKLSELINDKRKISAEFSYLLSQILDTNPRMWLNLQTNVELYDVRKKYDEAA
jgi:addiction module HigA family antidote